MKKLTSFLLLLTLLLPCLLLAGCTGEPADTQGSEPNDTQSSAAETGTDTSADTNEEEKDDGPKGVYAMTPSDGKKLRIAFIGDSITYGHGTANPSTDSFPSQMSMNFSAREFLIGNFGKNASYALPADNKYNVKDKALTYRNTDPYKQSLDFKPDVVVIMLGVNDMRSMTCEEAKKDLKDALVSLAEEYKALESVQKVYIATSIYIPSSAMAVQMSDGELQRIQKQAAAEAECEVIDIFSMTYDYMQVRMHTTSDRLHPTKAMLGEMARAFRCALTEEEFVATKPAISESGVVYLKTGGTGDGSSASSPVGTLPAAIGLVRDGGTIVVCGPYSLPYEMHTPKNNGTITITSKYNGEDYLKSGARLGLAKNLYLYGDFIFKDIEIRNETGALVTCNYNNVTFDTGIVSTRSSGVTTDPTIVVGHTLDSDGAPIDQISLHGECNITVNSGSWAYINGGNRRSRGSLPIGTSDKDAKLNITVNGGEFTYSGVNVMAGVGMCSFAGECNFVINGGKFLANVYALSRVGSNTTPNPAEMSGKVNMTVKGGEFSGKIIRNQDNTTKITGEINITVAEKYKSLLSGFTNVTVN